MDNEQIQKPRKSFSADSTEMPTITTSAFANAFRNKNETESTANMIAKASVATTHDKPMMIVTANGRAMKEVIADTIIAHTSKQSSAMN